MQRHFDEELATLNGDILRMGGLVEQAIARAVLALRHQSAEEADRVIADDSVIDELDLAIDEKCLDLLARWQPMAADLRFITMAMKICTDLERVADLAADIAHWARDIADRPLLKPLIDIPKLAEVAQGMVHDSIEAFLRRDAVLAQRTILSDTEANRLRDLIQDELINDYMTRDGSTAPRAVPLLIIGRHLERICDHATNICESVIFMVQARVVKHRLEELHRAGGEEP